MANKTKNLTPFGTIDRELAVAISSKGGKACAEKKRQRKTFKEAYLSIAGTPFKPIGTEPFNKDTA